MAPAESGATAAALQNGSGGDRRGSGGGGPGGGGGGKSSTKLAALSTSSSSGAGGGAASGGGGARIADQYPVNTLWEMTLENGEVVSGSVYCTDEFSQSVVIQKQLVHTTLASQLHVVNAAAVTKALRQAEEEGGDGDKGIPLSRPLLKVHKKVLEERERKALRQAEESFRHINQKVRQMLECVAWVSVLKSSEYLWTL
jgi:transposase-like protein